MVRKEISIMIQTENSVPMPGDAVMFIGKETDILLKANTIGIINGTVGRQKAEYLVVFNCTGWAFRGKNHAYCNGNEYVDCSGGPGYFLPTSVLIPTCKSIKFTFWRWQDFPRAGGGERYQLEIPLWHWLGNR